MRWSIIEYNLPFKMYYIFLLSSHLEEVILTLECIQLHSAKCFKNL